MKEDRQMMIWDFENSILNLPIDVVVRFDMSYFKIGKNTIKNILSRFNNKFMVDIGDEIITIVKIK